MSNWTKQAPIWVSRKDADDRIASFEIQLWAMVLIGALAVVNAIVWGVIGLACAVSLVVGWLT